MFSARWDTVSVNYCSGSAVGLVVSPVIVPCMNCDWIKILMMIVTSFEAAAIHDRVSTATLNVRQ